MAKDKSYCSITMNGKTYEGKYSIYMRGGKLYVDDKLVESFDKRTYPQPPAPTIYTLLTVVILSLFAIYLLAMLIAVILGCGPDHRQNVDISPPALGGAPQHSFNNDYCITGQKVSCEYSYSTASNGDTVITYGYRVCLNNVYGACVKS